MTTDECYQLVQQVKDARWEARHDYMMGVGPIVTVLKAIDSRYVPVAHLDSAEAVQTWCDDWGAYESDYDLADWTLTITDCTPGAFPAGDPT